MQTDYSYLRMYLAIYIMINYLAKLYGLRQIDSTYINSSFIATYVINEASEGDLCSLTKRTFAVLVDSQYLCSCII